MIKSKKARQFIKNREFQTELCWTEFLGSLVESRSAKRAVELAEQEMAERAIAAFVEISGDKTCCESALCEKKDYFIELLNKE